MLIIINGLKDLTVLTHGRTGNKTLANYSQDAVNQQLGMVEYTRYRRQQYHSCPLFPGCSKPTARVGRVHKIQRATV